MDRVSEISEIVKKYKICETVIGFLMMMIFSMNVQFAYANTGYVIDNAEILSENEESKLIQDIKNVKSEHGVEVFVITENEVYTSNANYIKSFYSDENLNDALIMLINMDENDRSVEIRGFNQAENVTDRRTDDILDDVVKYLAKGDYYGGCNEFVYLCGYYLEKGENSNTYDFLIINVIALVIAGVTIAMMISNSSGKNHTKHVTYAEYNSKKVLGRYDRYTHTTRSVRQKPKSSGGGSFGGGGSGGGRRF